MLLNLNIKILGCLGPAYEADEQEAGEDGGAEEEEGWRQAQALQPLDQEEMVVKGRRGRSFLALPPHSVVSVDKLDMVLELLGTFQVCGAIGETGESAQSLVEGENRAGRITDKIIFPTLQCAR